jgi:hypothetical protein
MLESAAAARSSNSTEGGWREPSRILPSNKEERHHSLAMPIKKSELYSSLWKSCDELRGGMDASQYKDTSSSSSS